MPTYSYACKDCGHAFDIVQAFSDDALTVCPNCGGALRKQYGNVGVVFKGSGFYRNDSRDTGAKKAAGSDSAKDASTETAKPAGDKGADKGGDTTASKPASPAASAAKSSSTSSTPASGGNAA